MIIISSQTVLNMNVYTFSYEVYWSRSPQTIKTSIKPSLSNYWSLETQINT